MPGAGFSFGGSSTPIAPSAPSTGGFSSFVPTAAPAQGTAFSFGGTAPPNSTPGFAPAAPSTHAPSFGGNAAFGATTSVMGVTQATAAASSAFSIGTGGSKRGPGAKRRIIKARRPPG